MLLRTDAFSAVRFLNRARTPILMYHRFSEDPTPFTTSRAELSAHLRYLTGKYNVIGLSELARMLSDGEDPPPNSAVVTIDDGYLDAFEIAKPIFDEYGVPATFFVVTDFVDGKCWIWTDKARYLLLNCEREAIDLEFDGRKVTARLNGRRSRIEAAGRINAELKQLTAAARDEKLEELASAVGVSIPDLPTDEFAPVSWKQAREMDLGNISIESHTVTHPILTNCTDEEVDLELSGSRAILEDKLQRSARIFCYPNGSQGERERSAVERSGYLAAVSTELRLLASGDDRFALPRVDAESDMSRFAQAVSGFDRFKATFR